MIVGRKGGASKMGKLAALSLHSAQGQTLAIPHTQEADSPSSGYLALPLASQT